MLKDYIIGAASAFNICGNFYGSSYDILHKDDISAMEKDAEAVANDFRIVLGEYNNKDK